jgi:hypothetical protein
MAPDPPEQEMQSHTEQSQANDSCGATGNVQSHGGKHTDQECHPAKQKGNNKLQRIQHTVQVKYKQPIHDEAKHNNT